MIRANSTLTELARASESGALSLDDMHIYYRQRIARHDEKIGAFVQVSEGPATGLPLAYKDIFCTKGVETTCASRMLQGFVPPYSATVVEKLEQAGFASLGKLNMDEFAMGSSNEHSIHGPCRNPWNTECVAGGSSGGSAAAVAAGLTPAALGTDTGGSIRQPAAFCGVTGIKPTYGRASRFGIVAYASSLDQAGVLARTAADCAWLLQTLCGHDERDSTSLNKPVPDWPAQLEMDLSGRKVGVVRQWLSDKVDDGVRQRVEQALEQYQALGAERVEVDLPELEWAIPAYYVIASAECSSNLSRYDGVRYGYRCEAPKDLHDLYSRSRAEGFGEEVKRRILLGTFALSAGYYDAYYRKAQQVRRKIHQAFQRAFEQVDVLAGPTTPTTAFAIGSVKDPVSMYQEDINTVAVNLAGLPGLSLPCGFSEGMPVGLQLVAPHLEEGRLLAWAHQYQQQTDWHTRLPQWLEDEA